MAKELARNLGMESVRAAEEAGANLSQVLGLDDLVASEADYFAATYIPW